MDPFIGARHVDGASSAKSSRPPFVAELSGAHTPFIADVMLLVHGNRLVTGFLFPELSVQRTVAHPGWRH
jgi:hypothetical protein